LFFAYFEISMVLLNPLICLPVLKLLTGVVHSDWVTFSVYSFVALSQLCYFCSCSSLRFSTFSIFGVNFQKRIYDFELYSNVTITCMTVFYQYITEYFLCSFRVSDKIPLPKKKQKTQ